MYTINIPITGLAAAKVLSLSIKNPKRRVLSPGGFHHFRAGFVFNRIGILCRYDGNRIIGNRVNSRRGVVLIYRVRFATFVVWECDLCGVNRLHWTPDLWFGTLMSITSPVTVSVFSTVAADSVHCFSMSVTLFPIRIQCDRSGRSQGLVLFFFKKYPQKAICYNCAQLTRLISCFHRTMYCF